MTMKRILSIVICIIGVITFFVALYLVVCKATMFYLCLATIMAAIPTVIYLYAVVLLDRFEPEPWIVIIGLFLWGIGVTSVSSLFLSEVIGNEIVSIFDAVPGIVIPVFVAPVVEESMKFLGIFCILMFRKDKLTDFTDVIVYASLVGLGFAMTENIFYYARAAVVPFLGDLVSLFAIRGILSALVHPFFTVMSATGLLLSYSVKKKTLKIILILLGLLLAIFFHGMWNATPIFGLMNGMLIMYFGVYIPSIVIIGLIVYYKIKMLKNAENKTVVHRLI